MIEIKEAIVKTISIKIILRISNLMIHNKTIFYWNNYELMINKIIEIIKLSLIMNNILIKNRAHHFFKSLKLIIVEHLKKV
jgi:hypothetical protein